MRTSEGDQIHELIRARRGRAQAISTLEICLQLGWPASRYRLVEQIISDESMLWPHCLVCFAPCVGYFCAASHEEAFACESWLRALRDEAQMKLDTFTAQCRKIGLHLSDGHFDEGVTAGIAAIMTAKQTQTS
jgi:hypothetical protein